MTAFIFIFCFFVQLFQDHMYIFFVTGVTFFSNIKSFYEIFLAFFSAHVVRVTEK